MVTGEEETMVQSEDSGSTLMTSIIEAFEVLDAYGHDGTVPATIHFEQGASGTWWAFSERWQLDGREPILVDLRTGLDLGELSA